MKIITLLLLFSLMSFFQSCQTSLLDDSYYPKAQKMCKDLQTNFSKYKKDNLDDCADALFYKCNKEQFDSTYEYVACIKKGRTDSICRKSDDQTCTNLMISALAE